MIKNVVFDWSGVISNDIKVVHKALLIVFEKLGIKKISLRQFREEFELPYTKFYEKYARGVSDDVLVSLYTKAIHSVEEPEMFRGVKNVLEFLRSNGIRMAVLSTHMKTKLDKEIINYGLEGFFVSVKGNIHDKTDELVNLMKECKFDPRETAYVGDMAHDIEVGKKAKVLTVGVSWGYYSNERLAKSRPDVMIDNISEIKRIIGK